MLIKNVNQFNAQKEKEQVTPERNIDKRYLNMKPGHQYYVRLLSTEAPASSPRKGMVFTYYTHGASDAQKQKHFFNCPQSFHEKGFFDCPVCQYTYKINKMDETAKKRPDIVELYRKWRGIVPAVVTYDKSNKENEGHVKLIRLTQDMYKYLISKGVVNDPSFKGTGNKDEAKKTAEELELEKRFRVGYKACDLENGLDLIITVTKKGEFNDYKCEFAPMASPITTPIEVLEKEYADLKMDEIVTPTSKEKMDEFFEKCVKKNVQAPRPTPPPFVNKAETVVKDESDSIPGLSPSKPVSQPAATVTSPVPAASSQSAISIEDIDALLNED